MAAKSYVLENGFLLLNDGSGKLLRGSLRVEGNRISKVAKSIPRKKNEVRIDLNGQLLIPGFVQTHTHLCQTLFRNLADDLPLLDWLKQRIWPMEGAHTEASLYASARLGIAELLSTGTTTILDMGTVRHTDVIFEAAAEMGIRAFIGKCLMDREENPKELREPKQLALKENAALFSRWHGKENNRLQYANAPRFVLSCSEALMKELKEFSAENRSIVHTHSSENKEEIAAVRKIYGCENIEALERMGLTNERLVLAHCIWLSENEKQILARSQTRVSHCPSSNLKLASGICSVPDLQKRGISVSIGADGAPCNNNLNMFQEMRLTSLLQKPQHGAAAMKAREVFEMATIEGAKALGIDADVGSLVAGKKADFALLDMNSISNLVELEEKNPERAYSALVYSSLHQVSQTWVDGKSVYRQGSFPKLKSQAVTDAARKEQKRLLSRLS